MRITIGKKVIGLFSVMFVIFAIATGVGLYVIRTFHNTMVEMSTLSSKVNLTGDLEFQVNKLTAPINRYLITGDIATRDSFDEIVNTISGLLGRLRALEGSTQWDEIRMDIEDDIAIIGEIGIDTLYMENPVGNEQAGSLIVELHSLGNNLIRDVDKFNSITEAEINRMEMTVSRLSLVNSVFIAIASGMLFLFALLLYYYIRRFVTVPISQLHRGAALIAEGQFEHRLEIKTGDEIEDLSIEFNKMSASLEKTRRKLDGKIQELEVSTNKLEGEITEREKVEEALRKSEKKIKKYSENLEKIVEERTRDLKKAQDQLILKEKLAAIGQLSSSVGHELRNPLGVISNSVHYLGMKIKDGDEKVNKHLEILEREVRRSDKIISDLLDFSRAREPEIERGDINRIIKESLADIEKDERISIETRLDTSLPEILIDPDQIHQVIVNLLTNAAHAMPEGGRIEITTGVKKDFLEMVIKDTGMGISEENLDKIFEPLYTSKAKGTGLGLTIMKGIIDRHKGKIGVESKVGEGTTFTVSFPLERKEALDGEEVQYPHSRR